MRNKLFIMIMLVLAFFMLLTSCTEPGATGMTHTDNSGSNQVIVTDDENINYALQVAGETLESMRGQDNVAWTDRSVVGDAFPVYLPGMDDEPSYYECKILTDSDDAGYVLVNVNQTDLLVSEVVCEGLTLTEQYRQALHHENFNVYRFDWFSSIAVSDSQTRSSNDYLASLGVDPVKTEIVRKEDNGARGSGDISKMLNTYTEDVRNNGCFPMYSKESLEEYYAELNEEKASRGWTYSTTSHSLKKKFPDGYSYPSWYQPSNSQGKPVGCGPTAIAMAYAYWRQFKGKARLFEGLDLTHKYRSYNCDSGPIYRAMWDINQDVYTITTTNWGMTLPQFMDRADRYAESFNYPSFVSEKSSQSGTKKNELINFVLGQLNVDKPVVLLINSSGYGVPNHYVTVASAMKTLKKRTILGISTTKYDRIGYYVNFGWSSGLRKWIYHMGGSNRYSVYKGFALNIGGDTVVPPRTPTPVPALSVSISIDQKKEFATAAVKNGSGSYQYTWIVDGENYPTTTNKECSIGFYTYVKYGNGGLYSVTVSVRDLKTGRTAKASTRVAGVGNNGLPL